MVTANACGTKPRRKLKLNPKLRPHRRTFNLRRKLKYFRCFVLEKLRSLTRKMRLIALRQQELGNEVHALGSQMGTIDSRFSSINTQIAQIQAQQAQTQAIQAQIDALTTPFSGLQSMLQSRVGAPVTIDTDAGPISGTLVAVGEDFAEIVEPTGELVFVLFSQINSIA